MSVGLINPEVAEKGGRIANAVMEGGAAGWATLIGKNVTYVVGANDYGIPAEVVKPEVVGEVVATPIDWSGDTQGKVWLLVSVIGANLTVGEGVVVPAHAMIESSVKGGSGDARE